MNCKICSRSCIKKGVRLNVQRWYCKSCNLSQQENYKYKRFDESQNKMLCMLTKEGVGTRGLSRIVGYPKTTIQRQIEKIAGQIPKPVHTENNQQYEMDELRTYVNHKKKESWIIYAINKKTKQVIDFTLGRRTKVNLLKVLKTLMDLNPRKIYTDKLPVYKSLIEKRIHAAARRKTNHIERKNVDLRKDIKSLVRKTICYSKSERMMTAKLMIYFFFASINMFT